jgi:hypothetical protein
MTTAFLFVFWQRYSYVNAKHIGFSLAVKICFYFLGDSRFPIANNTALHTIIEIK